MKLFYTIKGYRPNFLYTLWIISNESNYFFQVEVKEIDFDNLEQHKEAFKEGDIAFCCLGTTKGKSGAEGFVKVDYDYVVNSAKLLKDNGACRDYHLVSSKGKYRFYFTSREG